MTMIVEVPTFNTTYKTRVGAPKKYEDLWSAMDKKVYILGTTLKKLRRVK